jgi:hypothetical protein
MKKQRTNQANTRDRIGRGGKVVLAKHKGKLPKPPKHMGTRKGR